MIRPPSSAAQAAKAIFVVWLFFTVTFLVAGGPWHLPLFIVGGGLVVGLPIVFILRALPAQEKAVAAVDAEEEKEFQLLNEYERAGFQVRRVFIRGWVVSGVIAGIGFKHYRTLGGRSRLPSTVLSIATNAPGEFDVRSDRGFDSRYRFAGRTAEYEALLSDPANVERLAAIFGEGCHGVRKVGRALSAVAIQQPRFWLMARIEAMVKALASLRLPAEVPGADNDPLPGLRSFHIVVAVAVATFVFGLACFSLTRPLLGGGMQFALDHAGLLGTLFLAMVGLSWLLVRGHPIAARQSLFMLALAVPVGMGLAGVLMLLNEKLDGSEARDHVARVLDRSEQKSRQQATYYYVQLESWSGVPTERIEVNAGDFNRSPAGTMWRIRTHEGWLRSEWIESAQLEGTKP